MEQDVLVKVSQTVTGDATIRTLTGWSAGDPRWYFYHRSDAVIDAARPAYMTYLLTANPESLQGVAPAVLSVIIWGHKRADVLAVRNRLRALLNKKTLVTSSNRKVRTRIVNEQDTYSEDTDFVGCQMQLRAAYLDP